MFQNHYNQQKQSIDEKKRGLRIADAILTQAMETYFAQQEPAIRQEILTAGTNPSKIDAMMQRIKLKLKIKLIEQFKIELKEEMNQTSKSLPNPPEVQ